MSVTGASIILWFYDDIAKQPILLTGKESKYMSDLPEYKDLVKDKEFFTGTDLVQAKKYFSKNAKDLEDILHNKIKIKFDTPILLGEGYHVHFRYLEKAFKRGVIKGGMEGDETSEQAILRETQEELGINIPKEQLVKLGICDGYQVYALDIKKKQYEFFIARIKERDTAKSGEVFDLSFKPLSMVEGQLPEYNYKSKCSISLFKEYLLGLRKGGKRNKNKSKNKSKKINKKSKRKDNKRRKSNKFTRKRYL